MYYFSPSSTSAVGTETRTGSTGRPARTCGHGAAPAPSPPRRRRARRLSAAPPPPPRPRSRPPAGAMGGERVRRGPPLPAPG